MIRISIITVCYNAENVIENTIQSVIKQSYPDIEYIIIDGASTDRTVEIINQYSDCSNIMFISEKDNGIYDAMNKGSRLATGDYVQYLNAGDTLINKEVIEKVVLKINMLKTDIVYGNIIYTYPDKTTATRLYSQFCSTKLYYLLGDCINHQAIFAKKECLGDTPFNTIYKICADREWMMRMKCQRKKFRAMNLLVCQYSLAETSTSVINKKLYCQEAEQCVQRNMKYGYWIYSLVERCRNSQTWARVLHVCYALVFLRRKSRG